MINGIGWVKNGPLHRVNGYQTYLISLNNVKKISANLSTAGEWRACSGKKYPEKPVVQKPPGGNHCN